MTYSCKCLPSLAFMSPTTASLAARGTTTELVPYLTPEGLSVLSLLLFFRLQVTGQMENMSYQLFFDIEVSKVWRIIHLEMGSLYIKVHLFGQISRWILSLSKRPRRDCERMYDSETRSIPGGFAGRRTSCSHDFYLGTLVHIRFILMAIICRCLSIYLTWDAVECLVITYTIWCVWSYVQAQDGTSSQSAAFNPVC